MAEARHLAGRLLWKAAAVVSSIGHSMKTRQATKQAAGATAGHSPSANGAWQNRVQHPRITDPKKRRAAVERATRRIKTDVRVDLTRERRGR